MLIISPSILAADFSMLGEVVRRADKAGADYFHFDVMDGCFVPNISFGPDILKAFCRASDLYKDVHLMVQDPSYYADVFMKAGADLITFHYEALEPQKILPLVQKIHDNGKKAGIAIKPGTSTEVLKPYLNDFDLFLIMSVEPGFGGQSFHMEATEKIAQLRKMIQEAGSTALIEVDGGINQETAALCRQAGVDVLVAGSYVFKRDIHKAVESLR